MASSIPDQRLDSGDLARGIFRWAVKNVIFTLLATLVIFLSAGRWDWGAGWWYLAVIVLIYILDAVVLIPINPGLIVERSELREGTKGWDRFFVRGMALLGPLVTWGVAGLDQRFQWSGPVDPLLLWVGLACTLLSGLLTLWAMAENRFFSATVRIQNDRGHQVISSGPYRFVRHPGYLGAVLFDLAAPLALASWWAIIPAVLTVGLVILRTALEDQTLQTELPGYVEYAGRVRYRLFPGIW